MNVEWAMRQVDELVRLLQQSYESWDGGAQRREVEDAIEALRPIYRQIRERVTTEPPGYSVGGSGYEWEWQGLRRDVLQVRELLRRREELEENLSPQGPRLSAAGLHRWVWDPAATYWDAGFPREAVRHAAESVDAHLRAKMAPTTLSGAQLATEAFTTNQPSAGQTVRRLRFPSVERGSDTWKNLHDGAMHLGRGCFMAIRNIATHELDDRGSEQAYLEQLAALSVFARMVDDAELVEEPSD